MIAAPAPARTRALEARRPEARPGSAAAQSRAARSGPAPWTVSVFGVLWLVVLLAGAELGVAVTALVVAPVAVVAAWSAARVARARGASGVVAALPPIVAAAALVVARGQGLSEALTLVCAICLYDMATFVTGSSGRWLRWVGPLVGVITVGVLTVFVAAVFVPPFSGARPWVLLGLVAVLAPGGVAVGRRLAGGARLPALLRLDSLIVSGPAWVVAVYLLMR
ncbi:MAG: hypothetical protein ACRDYY_02505 [Acidimicrobiales bacterium]